VLLKSLTRLPQVRDPAAVMGWLSRMADNEIRDRVDYAHRQRRDAVRRVPVDEDVMDLPSPIRQALSLAIVAEEHERLERALEALPDAQREAIVLRKLEELSFPEMAVRLGKSEDACRMMFARAMAALTLQLRALVMSSRSRRCWSGRRTPSCMARCRRSKKSRPSPIRRAPARARKVSGVVHQARRGHERDAGQPV
jgi:RNA polymerase sigma-70 factor (ECF subfamily)